MSRAAGALALAFAAFALLAWNWVSASPWIALFAITLFVFVCALVGRHERLKQQAIDDARLRDEHVPSMSPREYEQFTARELERAGWKVLHCGGIGDQGCDVLAELRSVRAVVQVKKYGARCGNSAIQEAVGSRKFYDAHLVVVVCPSGYTRSAVALAKANGAFLLHHSELGTLERLARIP